MIVGGDPEDGHYGGPPPLLEQAGGLPGGQGLVEHVERSAEEAGLLPGHDRHRAGVAQESRPRGGPRGSARFLLPDERRRHGVAWPLQGQRAPARLEQSGQVPPTSAVEPESLGLAGQIIPEQRARGVSERPVFEDTTGAIRALLHRPPTLSLPT